MAGFTTVRKLNQAYPGDAFIDVALSKASENDWIEAPHIIPAANAISITGWHQDAERKCSYPRITFTNDFRSRWIAKIAKASSLNSISL